MARDLYASVWVSHSSIGAYLKCPRAYYLGYVYKNPLTGNRIGLMQPALALGQTVHQVLESLSVINAEDRFKEPLIDKFEQVWNTVSGKLGGFKTIEEEHQYKQRGVSMLARVTENPGLFTRKAIKIKQDSALPPHYLFSEKENIILCGKVDWLEYLPETDSVHIVDFKTGKHDEDEDSLQLAIYLLLTKNCQKRKVTKASYWYLERENVPTEMVLPDEEVAFDKIMVAAKKVKLARELKTFKCPGGESGCFACRSYEIVYRGGGELVSQSDSKQDIYVV